MRYSGYHPFCISLISGDLVIICNMEIKMTDTRACSRKKMKQQSMGSDIIIAGPNETAAKVDAVNESMPYQ